MEKYYYQIRNLLVNGESFNLAIFICFLILLIYVIATIYIKYSDEYDFSIYDEPKGIVYCRYIKSYGKDFFKEISIIVILSLLIDLILGWETFNFIKEYSIAILGFIIIIKYIDFNNLREVINNSNKSYKLINPDSNDLRFSKIKNKNELDCNSYIKTYESKIKRIKLQLDLLKHFIGPAILAPLMSLFTNYFGEKGLPVYITEIVSIMSIIVLMFFWCKYKKLIVFESIKNNYEDALYIIKNAIIYTEQERKERQIKKFMEVQSMKLNNKVKDLNSLS